MLHLNDDKSKAFFEPVIDVKYVVGMNLPRVDLNSLEQYIDLALMYNQSISSTDSNRYLELLSDEKGVRYARLYCSGIQYALSIGSSLIPEKKSLKNVRDVPLINATNLSEPERMDDKSLEDKIKNYDSLDIIGGMSNVDPKYVANDALKDSFDELKRKPRDYFSS
jgi:hypothetical protein